MRTCKSIIENGFKEVETKQQKMFDWIQNENNSRMNEILDVKHMFNNQYYEIEGFRNKVVDVENLHEKTIDDLKSKFENETEEKVKLNICNIEERVNDIEAKLRIEFVIRLRNSVNWKMLWNQ